jgi:hypothetical protein
VPDDKPLPDPDPEPAPSDSFSLEELIEIIEKAGCIWAMQGTRGAYTAVIQRSTLSQRHPFIGDELSGWEAVSGGTPVETLLAAMEDKGIKRGKS